MLSQNIIKSIAMNKLRMNKSEFIMFRSTELFVRYESILILVFMLEDFLHQFVLVWQVFDACFGRFGHLLLQIRTDLKCEIN